jgi:hypothetical protein
MATVLLVANQTLAGGHVAEFVRSRMGAERPEFTLLVPATAHADVTAFANRTARVLGAAGAGATATEGAPQSGEDPDYEHARARLEFGLSGLRSLGATVDGVVGPAHPFTAISEVVERRHFDEVVLFTLPKGVSRWLHLDIPHRVERKFRVPVTVITTG